MRKSLEFGWEKAEEVGCFLVQHQEGERWICLNRYNDVSHVTFGTQEEVYECIKRQSKIWKSKGGSHQGRGNWKGNMTAHTEEAKAKKKDK